MLRMRFYFTRSQVSCGVRELTGTSLDQRFLSICLSEVARECELAQAAVAHFNRAIGRQPPEGEGEGRHAEVFRALHSFLSHASNASKLFWPPKPRQRKSESPEDFAARRTDTLERAAVLRHSVGISDESPLRDRALRDHLEHFDERMVEWRKTSVNGNYYRDTIAPRGMVAGVEPRDAMRWYDPDSRVFLFRGESYDVQSLVAAVEELLPKANQASQAAWQQFIHRAPAP
jgi:hypothetical protein